MTPDRLRVYPLAVAVSMLALWVGSIVFGPGITDTARNIIGGDFAAFYTGGRFFLEGRMDDLYNFAAQKAYQESLVAPVETQQVHPYVNPPFAIAMYAPFAVPDYVTGLLMWWAMGLALLTAALSMLRNELFDRQAMSVRRLVMLAFLFFPTFGWLMYGQNTSITLFLFTVMFVMLRRRRDLAGGIALGLLFYKPQLMIAAGVMLLVHRRWRALAGAALGVGFWGVAGLVLCPGSMVEYAHLSPTLFEFLRTKGQILGTYIQYPIWGSHGFFGFCILLLDGVSRSATDRLTLALTVGGGLAVAAAWWRTSWEPGTKWWDLMVAATLALGLLVSPHLFLYDLMLLLLPMIIVGSHYRGGTAGRPLDGGPLLAATALLYAATFLSSYLADAQLEITEAVGLPRMAVQLSTPIIVGWAWIAYRAARDPARADEASSVVPAETVPT